MFLIPIKLLIPLMMLTTSGEAGNRRVIDRFPNSKFPTPSRCLIGIIGVGEVSAQANTGATRRMVKEEGRALINAFNQMNCTLVQLPATSTGHMDANGSYDGLAGYVQRNEIDIPLFYYRTDFFSNVIGHMCTQAWPADVVIFSRKYEPHIEKYPLLQLWTSGFDVLTVTYVLISVFLFITVFTLTEALLIRKSRGRLMKRLLKKTYINIFKVFSSFVDQENFDATSNTGMIIVWFFNLFLLFFVHGFVLGSMGADLVALIDPPVINSMYEFTNTSETQPVIIKQMQLTPLLEKAKPGTDLWHLNSVLKSKNDSNIFSLDISQNFMKVLQSVSVLLDEAIRSLKALVIADLVLEFFKPLLCELNSVLMSKLRSSQKLFFPGVFTTIMSLKIDPNLRQIWNYFVGTACETGLLSGTSGFITRMSMSLMGQTYTGKSCETVQEKEHSISSFDWLTFEPIFRVFAILMLACAVVLLIEKYGQNRYVVVQFLVPVSRRSFAFLVQLIVMTVMWLAAGVCRSCRNLTRLSTRFETRY